MDIWCTPRIKSLEKSTVKLNNQIESLDRTCEDLTDQLDMIESQISDLEEDKHGLDDVEIKHIIQQTLKEYLQMAFGIQVPDDRKT
jgi:prefoldin subunit 5